MAPPVPSRRASSGSPVRPGEPGGLTLVEMIIVIVILGVLAGIVMPLMSASDDASIAEQVTLGGYTNLVIISRVTSPTLPGWMPNSRQTRSARARRCGFARSSGPEKTPILRPTW